MPVESDVDPFEEIERLLGRADTVVPVAVARELRELSTAGTGDRARAAKVGSRLAADRCRELDHEHESADTAIATLAADGAVDYVATNDGPLRDRVLAAEIPVISLRGRNNMTIIHP